jgi:hypothetical protein
VPQIPIASVSTNTGPSVSGGSSTSESSADPALSGMTVSAFMGSSLFLQPVAALRRLVTWGRLRLGGRDSEGNSDTV